MKYYIGFSLKTSQEGKKSGRNRFNNKMLIILKMADGTQRFNILFSLIKLIVAIVTLKKKNLCSHTIQAQYMLFL